MSAGQQTLLARFTAGFPQERSVAAALLIGATAGVLALATRAAFPLTIQISHLYVLAIVAVAGAAAAGGAASALAAALTMTVGSRLAFRDWFWVQAEPAGLAAWLGGLTLVSALVVLLRRAALEVRRKQDLADDALRRLQTAQEHGRRFVDLTPHIAWTADPQGRLTLLPKRLQALTGSPAEDLINEGWRALVHPDDLPAVDEAWRKALATGEPYIVEFRGLRADGAYIWMRSQAYAHRDESGAIVGWYGLTENIDARKEAERDREMLMREVDHRARNILSVLQGLVATMPKNDPEAFAESFRARLQALAGAHSLLARSRWRGVELRALLEEELEPFGLERAHLVGNALLVRPERVQNVSMVVHELTTNSAKYGALSCPQGRLRVEWRLVDDVHVQIEWTETGGPRVVTPPVRQGFGSTLIRSIAGRRQGESVMEDWRPEGLCCSIVMADLAQGDTEPEAHAQAGP